MFDEGSLSSTSTYQSKGVRGLFDRLDGAVYLSSTSLPCTRAEVGEVCLIGGRQHPSAEPLPSSLPCSPLRSSAQG